MHRLGGHGVDCRGGVELPYCVVPWLLVLPYFGVELRRSRNDILAQSATEAGQCVLLLSIGYDDIAVRVPAFSIRQFFRANTRRCSVSLEAVITFAGGWVA